jgi:hypothetical protein
MEVCLPLFIQSSHPLSIGSFHPQTVQPNIINLTKIRNKSVTRMIFSQPFFFFDNRLLFDLASKSVEKIDARENAVNKCRPRRSFLIS